jgi:hypothetical protein
MTYSVVFSARTPFTAPWPARTQAKNVVLRRGTLQYKGRRPRPLDDGGMTYSVVFSASAHNKTQVSFKSYIPHMLLTRSMRNNIIP